jgi:hypothetical protein
MEHKLSVALSIGFILFVAAIAMWDLFAIMSSGRYATVTSYIQDLSTQYTLLPFLFGMVIGHLFWPGK